MAIIMTSAVFPNVAATVTPGGLGLWQPWTNPNNIKTNNNVDATTSIGGANPSESEYLTGTDFSAWSLPSGFNVVGVQVEIEVLASLNSVIRDLEVRLQKDGSTFSPSNLAQAGTWTTTRTVRTYGGSGNLWGFSSLTTDEANAITFGAFISAECTDKSTARTASVDFMRLTLWYDNTPPVTGEKGITRSITRSLTQRIAS